MNPFFEVVHEYGWDLKDLGSVQVLTDRQDNIIRSLNRDDIEYLADHGIKYNPKTDQYEISTSEFFERGFHPENFMKKSENY